MGTLHEDQYKFSFIIYRPIFLRMRNVSDKYIEEIETHILHSVTFFFENRAVYEIMWKNIVEWSRPHMTKWNHAYCMLGN
jgi:hypothetical protein